jgi:hypothetical protein
MVPLVRVMPKLSVSVTGDIYNVRAHAPRLEVIAYKCFTQLPESTMTVSRTCALPSEPLQVLSLDFALA